MAVSDPIPPSLRELLLFYADAGVDEAIEEAPIDRFAETALVGRQAETGSGRNDRDARPATMQPEPRQPARPPTEPRSPVPMAAARPAEAAAVPDEAQAARARELARSAATMAELREILAGFDGCNLKFTAKNLVFADGNPAAEIMFIGEAPGREEDLEGRPFVGRSGQLLDRMIAAIGLDRTTAYIANVIPWRPPGNRTPTPLETEICRPFIERQIELVAPRVIVSLGGASAKVVLNTTEGIMRLRGNWRAHCTASGTDVAVMPTLHPAYLLRNPAHKKLAWRDLLAVKARLRGD